MNFSCPTYEDLASSAHVRSWTVLHLVLLEIVIVSVPSFDGVLRTFRVLSMNNHGGLKR